MTPGSQATGTIRLKEYLERNSERNEYEECEL